MVVVDYNEAVNEVVVKVVIHYIAKVDGVDVVVADDVIFGGERVKVFLLEIIRFEELQANFSATKLDNFMAISYYNFFGYFDYFDF